jgi:hypothetical protein
MTSVLEVLVARLNSSASRSTSAFLMLIAML